MQTKQITTSFIKVLQFDFTQSDHWFTFYWAHWNTSHWRDSTYWLYAYHYGSSPQACAWSIPSTVYNAGVLRKVILNLYSNKTWAWWWISYQLDTKTSRVWWRWLAINFSSDLTTNTFNTPANTEYTRTIDLIAKKTYTSLNSTELSFTDADVTMIRNYLVNWQLNLCAMLENISWTYSWIRKATFYMK